LHALQQCIEPALPLKSVIENWNQIVSDLRERPRQRVPQINIY
jgi:hypothetical protein